MSLENFEKNESLSFKDKYRAKADENGFISVGDFATTELRRQAKSIASFLDGDEGTNPEADLGGGLNFKGKSGNYSDMKIHIDDLDEFIKRVRNFYGE
jgi:hypothetical protein